MPDYESTTSEPADPTPEPPAGAAGDTPADTPAATPGGAGGDGGGGDGGGPPILSRKELRAQRQGASRTKWYVLGAVAVLLIGGVVAAVVASGSTTKKRAVPATTTSTVPAVVATCPLTGTPAPGGVVPARPAVAAKIGNYTDDRPSAGLNQADVVFEEPVEGSYTRLGAVFLLPPRPSGAARL